MMDSLTRKGSATLALRFLPPHSLTCCSGGIGFHPQVGLALDDVADALHVADTSQRERSSRRRSGATAGHPIVSAMCGMWHSVSAASEHLRSCWDDIRLRAPPLMREGPFEVRILHSPIPPSPSPPTHILFPSSPNSTPCDREPSREPHVTSSHFTSSYFRSSCISR